MILISYETDIVAWVNEQAQLLRSGLFELTHSRGDIGRVGRELASRIVIFLPICSNGSFNRSAKDVADKFSFAINTGLVRLHLKQVPSLKVKLGDAKCWEVVWGDAIYQASKKTSLDNFLKYVHG